jgi:hypothetical protein
MLRCVPKDGGLRPEGAKGAPFQGRDLHGFPHVHRCMSGHHVLAGTRAPNAERQTPPVAPVLLTCCEAHHASCGKPLGQLQDNFPECHAE